MIETLSVRRIAAALLCLLPLAACKGGEAEEEVEHPSEVVTQWNGSTELFLEYPHPVAGKEVGNWAIHLTDMEGFKPITSGTLTVHFVKDGRVAEQFTLPKPARNGIFILDPLVREPGTYQVQLALRSPQATSTHTLPDVRVWADAGQLPKQPEEEQGGGISFLKEQQWVIDFAVEPATEREVARSVSAAAEIVPVDGAAVQVSSPSSGIAMAEANRGAPSVGTPVRAGQVLAVLSPTSEEGGYARSGRTSSVSSARQHERNACSPRAPSPPSGWRKCVTSWRWRVPRRGRWAAVPTRTTAIASARRSPAT